MAIAAGMLAASACLDVSSPIPGIGSISQIIAPSPSVVVGDTLRDSTGAVAPLRVVVFATNGDTVRDAIVRFVVVDSTKKLRVDAAGLAFGDSLSPLARVFAVVSSAAGAGSVQTSLLTLPVVPKPVSAAADSLVPDLRFVLDPDSTASTLLSHPLSVTVRSAAGGPVPSYLVSFEIADSIPSRNAQPTLVLVGDDARASTVDTTNASGQASRRLRVRLSALPEGILGGETATVRVLAHVRFRGAEIPGSPVEFSIRVHQ